MAELGRRANRKYGKAVTGESKAQAATRKATALLHRPAKSGREVGRRFHALAHLFEADR